MHKMLAIIWHAKSNAGLRVFCNGKLSIFARAVERPVKPHSKMEYKKSFRNTVMWSNL